MRSLQLEPTPADPDAEPIPQKPDRTFRRIGLGVLAVIGLVSLDAWALPFDVLGTQAERREQREEAARSEALRLEGRELYAAAFFDGESVELLSGDDDVVIPRNPLLAELRTLGYHETKLAEWIDAYDRYRGVAEQAVHKDYPTWGNPPHVNISEYSDDRPRYYVVSPGDSELVGLPTYPETPSSIYAAFDGDEAYEGDITITVGDGVMEITNHGLGEHGVHLFAVAPESAEQPSDG